MFCFFCKILLKIGFVICIISYVNSTCNLDEPTKTHYGIKSNKECADVCNEKKSNYIEYLCEGFLYHYITERCDCYIKEGGYKVDPERADKCNPNPCYNNGNCLKTADHSSFMCICEKGYHGKRCQDKCKWCGDMLCFNGGTCVYDGPNCNGSCQCPLPYTGKTCSETSCPEGFTYLPSSESCYMLYHRKRTYDESYQICDRYNPYGRLFVVRNKKVADELYAKIDEQHPGYLDTTLDEYSSKMWLNGRRYYDDSSVCSTYSFTTKYRGFGGSLPYAQWKTDSTGKPIEPDCSDKHKKCIAIEKSVFNESLVWVVRHCGYLMRPICETPLGSL